MIPYFGYKPQIDNGADFTQISKKVDFGMSPYDLFFSLLLTYLLFLITEVLVLVSDIYLLTIFYNFINFSFPTPHLGHVQLSGKSSNLISSLLSSYMYPQTIH